MAAADEALKRVRANTSLTVFARMRPRTKAEAKRGDQLDEISLAVSEGSGDDVCKNIYYTAPSRKASTQQSVGAAKRTVTYGPFEAVFLPHNNNRDVYEKAILPLVEAVLSGSNAGAFCYGHTGSGKTHTVLGNADLGEKGAFFFAAERLFAGLPHLELFVAVRVAEVYNDTVYDLLSLDHAECSVREGEFGQVAIRSPTEVLPGGKVRVRPLTTKVVRNAQELIHYIEKAMQHRAVGVSQQHDKSSRSHALLELEIVSEEIVALRDAVIERESELVPVGKVRDTIKMAEEGKMYKDPQTGRIVGYNPNCPDVNFEAIAASEAEFKKAEAPYLAAQEMERNAMAAWKLRAPAVGSKLVFVDLAGSELSRDVTATGLKQTPAEKKEGRYINVSLLALKECFRALGNNSQKTSPSSHGEERVPFRNSKLTLLLRDVLTGADGCRAAMIATVCSVAGPQIIQSANTLQYANLVAEATH